MEGPRRGWRTHLEWWIPAAYAAVAAVWIYGSDALVAALAGSVERVRMLSTYKGLGYVAVTALLLHAGLRWALRRERAAADRVRESEALLRDVTDAIPDPVVLKGRDGRWIFSNPATLEVIGRTMEQVIGRTDVEIYDDRSVGGALMETDRRIMESGAPEVVEERILGPRGYRTFLSTKAPLRDAEGRIVGLIGNARDITDRKRAEEELLAAEERFQRAQKLESVGRLAGGVAHDFNNLLTVVLAGSASLRDALRAGAAPALEDVEQIHAAGERARELTARLLAFARKQVVSPVALDLNEVVRGSESLLRRLAGEEVELRIDLAGGLWATICDPVHVEQVLLNLVVNARDAMPRGGTLTLETRNESVDAARAAREPDRPAGEFVKLVVRDTGVGMTPEVKAHLFEPFFTTKPKGTGTGLGLATVHGIVSQAGGTVRVESEPGRGTTFELLLPRAARAAVPAPAGETARARGGAETVLVVEDDPMVREVTARVLRSGGYGVRVAGSGTEALILAGRPEGPPALVVTDVVMPGMDGRALADELRRRHAGLRVLFVSGYPQDVIGHRGVLEPGVDLLSKPFTPAALLERVRAVLDR